MLAEVNVYQKRHYLLGVNLGMKGAYMNQMIFYQKGGRLYRLGVILGKRGHILVEKFKYTKVV